MQVKKQKHSLRQKLDNKEIDVNTFVSNMNNLNDEMLEAEKEMLNEYDNMSVSLVNSDKKMKEVNVKNSELLNKIKLLDKSVENAKKYHHLIIKKDKLIHKLKGNIKKEFLDFGENMIPKSYIRISNRFPHLTLPQIIDFEKKIRENGGSIQVHKGKFVLTKRVVDNFTGSYSRSFDDRCLNYISWNCCHSVARDDHNRAFHVLPVTKLNNPNIIQMPNFKSSISLVNKIDKTTINERYENNIRGAVDLVNPSPDGQCDFPETFYLNEKDEKMKDIKEVKVKDVSSAISNNINVLEDEIGNHHQKILKLKELQNNLNLLIDQ